MRTSVTALALLLPLLCGAGGTGEPKRRIVIVEDKDPPLEPPAAPAAALERPEPQQKAGPGVTGSVSVLATMSFATREYAYSYNVSNDAASQRSLDMVRIETPSPGAVRNVRSPRGWTFHVSSSTGRVTWSAMDRASRIPPGEILGGFSFASPFRPETHRFALANIFEPRGPILPGDSDDDAPAPSEDETFFFGDTQLPSNPCEPSFDPDGDGICGTRDNCPNAANPDQRDRGGVGQPGDPEGDIPDRIGDACQCGDLDGNGRVNAADIPVLRLCLGSRGRCDRPTCDVGGPAGCEAGDATIIAGAVSGSGEPVRNVCRAFRRESLG